MSDDIFRHSWRLVAEVPDMAVLPPQGPPEVAFAGRSNVGKSSLINAVVRQGGLARTSNTPGRTQSLFFFTPEDPEERPGLIPPVALVDMPGYGYAKAPKPLVARWGQLMHAYVLGRATLRRVFLLVDARHGLKPADETLMRELDTAGVNYQIALTKADKVKPVELAQVERATADGIGRRPAAHPAIIVTSAETGLGLDRIRSEIAAFSTR